ncbi:MAG: GGDEF domain-containing protein [Candidatus Berkiella sp.]
MGQQPHMISAQDYEHANGHDLGQVLQTTLDVYDLLKRFHQALQAKVNYHSFHFSNPSSQHRLSIGSIALVETVFQLTLHNNLLGEIRLTKPEPFTQQESQLIENALSQLVYPLHNAITYNTVVIHSITCPLTGLGNRSLFDQTIQREINLAKRHQSSFALLLIDIDNFKQINDQHGHLAGDTILRGMGKLLLELKRNTDYAFRYGGEEFILILSQSTIKGASLAAERIRQQIEHQLKITVSMGLTHFKPQDTFDTLFQRVDSALYFAKANGKNQICQN